MKGLFISIFSFCLILAGCGGDKAAYGHGPDGESGEYQHGNTGESHPARPSRPASKLQEIKATEAGKTPLNLALYFLQQEKGKRGYGYAVAKLVVALVEAGDQESAAEVALLASESQGTRGLVYLVKHAAETGDVALALKVAQWIGPAGDRAFALCQVAMAQAKEGNSSAAVATIQKANRLVRNISQNEKANVLIEIASAQLAAGKKQQAVATGAQALKWIRADKNGFRNANRYKRLARVLVGAGAVQKAKELIKPGNDMFTSSLNASARTDIAVIMAEEGEVAVALEWVKQFPGRSDQKKAEAYGKIAEGLAEKGKFKEALEVLKNDKSMFLSKSQAIGDIAERLANAGKIDEALALMPQLRGDMAKEPALRAIASAQVKAGQKEAALATLKLADEAADKVADMFRPKREVLIASAFGCVEAGDMEMAVEKLKEAATEAMKVNERNIPDYMVKDQFLASRLRKVRKAMNQIGDETGAAALLKKELRLAEGIKDPLRQALALSATADTLANQGEYQQSWETIQKITNDAQRKKETKNRAKWFAYTSEKYYGHYGTLDKMVDISRLKKSFTPEEQAFAKQLVESIQGD